MSRSTKVAEPVADIPQCLSQPEYLGWRLARPLAGIERSGQEPGRLRVGVSGGGPLGGDTRVVAGGRVALSVELVQRELGHLGLRRSGGTAL